MENDVIKYHTRDGNGTDIIKEVAIKKYKPYSVECECPICHKPITTGYKIKDIVSANYTDWEYVGDYVCGDCADLFSLYFYSYVKDPDGIRLLNVRELRDALITPQKPPFLFIITTSKKKHLFYRARWNYSPARYCVNLETETISTTPERMRTLFDFVECLMTLGCSKTALSTGEIQFNVAQMVGVKAYQFLAHELAHSREIQIPLYCGQKREITEEDARCIINSILTA